MATSTPAIKQEPIVKQEPVIKREPLETSVTLGSFEMNIPSRSTVQGTESRTLVDKAVNLLNLLKRQSENSQDVILKLRVNAMQSLVDTLIEERDTVENSAKSALEQLEMLLHGENNTQEVKDEQVDLPVGRRTARIRGAIRRQTEDVINAESDRKILEAFLEIYMFSGRPPVFHDQGTVTDLQRILKAEYDRLEAYLSSLPPTLTNCNIDRVLRNNNGIKKAVLRERLFWLKRLLDSLSFSENAPDNDQDIVEKNELLVSNILHHINQLFSAFEYVQIPGGLTIYPEDGPINRETYMAAADSLQVMYATLHRGGGPDPAEDDTEEQKLARKILMAKIEKSKHKFINTWEPFVGSIIRDVLQRIEDSYSTIFRICREYREQDLYDVEAWTDTESDSAYVIQLHDPETVRDYQTAKYFTITALFQMLKNVILPSTGGDEDQGSGARYHRKLAEFRLLSEAFWSEGGPYPKDTDPETTRGFKERIVRLRDSTGQLLVEEYGGLLEDQVALRQILDQISVAYREMFDFVAFTGMSLVLLGIQPFQVPGPPIFQ